MGEVTGALKEYRILAGPEGAPVSSQSVYAERALHRIEALRNQATVPASARSGHTALYVSFSNLPPMAQVESWVRQLSAQGVSAILVDASLESSFTRPPVPTAAPTSTPVAEPPHGRVVRDLTGSRDDRLVRCAGPASA
jgi:hypothetical protein